MIAYRKPARSLAALLLAGAGLAACATAQPRLSDRLPASHTAPSGGGVAKIGDPYQVAGVWYVPREQPDYDVTGLASWYGDAFDQKPTANGEIFDMGAISGAHPTLPLPSMVEVTNLDNGRRLMVRLNDRGPFVDGRVIDLSHAAARELGYDQRGLARVRVRYAGPAATPASGLRYVANTRTPPAPQFAPQFSARTRAAAVDPPAPLRAPPAMALAAGAPTPASVSSSVLPPAAPTTQAALQLASQTFPAPAPVTVAAPTLLYRIQAGAFSDPVNAQRVAGQLASAGQAQIEPVQHNGATLYRVMLPGPTDEAEAFALRDRVAQLGFADARVIRPQ